MMLQKMTLGRTRMEVTQLGYGTMELRHLTITGGWAPDEDRAERVLNAVLDAGINFIDTSWTYQNSEEFIGRYIGHRRNEYFISTKCGHFWRDDPDRSGWSHEGLLNCIEESLTRLRTDHVDILQLHNPTREEIQRYNCVSTLQEIQAQGKTRFIGVSTTLPYVEEFLEMGVFDTFQLPYSALEPENEEMLSRIAQRGAGTIIRGGVAKGAPVVQTSDLPQFANIKLRWEKAGLGALVPQLDPLELLLRFTLSHPSVHTVIVGTKDLGHLQANLRAAEKGPLDARLVEAIRTQVASVLS
ncbi:aldo/keto reductase [Chloroflexota bacterium]